MEIARQTKRGATPMPRRLDPESETEGIRLLAPKSWYQRVDEWRRQQPDIPNRSEAIRRLVDRGLAEGEGAKARKKGGKL